MDEQPPRTFDFSLSFALKRHLLDRAIESQILKVCLRQTHQTHWRVWVSLAALGILKQKQMTAL